MNKQTRMRTIKGHKTYSVMWLAEHFLYSKRIHNKRTAYSSKIADRLPIPECQLLPMPEMKEFNLETFVNKYRNAGSPVVMRGAAKDWVACQKWNPNYLAQHYPEEQVILFDATIKDKSTPLRSEVEYKSLADFVEGMNKGSDEYARFLPMLDNNPELLDDFDRDFFKAAMGKRAKQEKRQLFMGGPRTSTSMHGALGSNLFVQVYGHKRWWIYSGKESSLLEPIVDHSFAMRSNVNAENPDGVFAKAVGWTVDLEPGDILYNPPFFWHQARSLDINIGIGFRWFDARAMIQSSKTQLLLTLTSTKPSLRKARKLEQNFAKIYAEILSKRINN